MNTAKPLIFKLWLACIGYILILVLSLAFIFPDSDFPDWFALVLKVTAIITVLAVALIPMLSLVHRVRQRNTPALAAAAYATIAGYALLFGTLLYVKLKTCDPAAIPHDARWHCQVSGKGVVVYFILIPIVGAIIGLLAAGLRRKSSKHKN